MKIADLIWLGQRLADAGRAEMQAYAPGVPAAELIVMRALIDGPPSTITALAGRTGYVQSRVSTAVAGLVERGWAETRSDPADGRRTLVLVPDRIRRAADDIQTGSETGTLDRLLAGRSPARRTAIVSALEELLAALREQAPGEHTAPSSYAAFAEQPWPPAPPSPGGAAADPTEPTTPA